MHVCFPTIKFTLKDASWFKCRSESLLQLSTNNRNIRNNAGIRFDYDSAVHLSFPPTRERVVRRRGGLKLPVEDSIYKGHKEPFSHGKLRGFDCVNSFDLVCASVCVNDVAASILVHCLSQKRESAAAARFPWKCWRRRAASQSLHLIGIPGNCRRKECSILRAVVYDPDKLAFARFRR